MLLAHAAVPAGLTEQLLRSKQLIGIEQLPAIEQLLKTEQMLKSEQAALSRLVTHGQCRARCWCKSEGGSQCVEGGERVERVKTLELLVAWGMSRSGLSAACACVQSLGPSFGFLG